MVRYAEEERRSLSDIENMMIRTPQNKEVPFSYIAKVDYGRGFSSIKRVDRERIITITGSIDDQVTSANKVHADIIKKLSTDLTTKYKGLSFSFGGRQEQQKKTMGSIGFGFIIALFLIYALLAIPFKSYTQPIIIMLAIPFGAVGAIGGHLLMGYNLSMMSYLGIVALSGVVVNDSLVLIDFVNTQYRVEKKSMYDAIVMGALKRFRPIMLTSVTTFLGLTPMILETSLQAKFLIPMAISLGFGIIFATVITLVLLPSAVLVFDDIAKIFKWIYDDKDEVENNKEVNYEA